jgi:hypothetical protein
MTEISTGLFEATLPALTCDSRVKYYVSADDATSGTICDPDTSAPFLAGVATSTTFVFDDNFQTYQGWGVMGGDATDGFWERGVPANDGFWGDPSADFDGSGICYVTDNEYQVDVDDGTTILRSPRLDLSAGEALIEYARWFSNHMGYVQHSASDLLEVRISNNDGATWTLVETVGPVEQASGSWYVHRFWVGDFVTPTAQVRLRFEATDGGSNSNVEAAVDAVKVTHYTCGPDVQIITEGLPDWTAGVPFSQQLEVSGGYGSITWSDKYDELVGTGLTLSATGLVSGTPIGAGTISFTAVATDETTRTDEERFSLQINPPLLVATDTLPNGKEGETYGYQLSASGGTGTRTWTDRDGDLAGTGLVLSADGLLSGVPVDTGTISFVARVEDAVGATDEKPLTLVVVPAYICGDVDGSGGNPNVADLTYLVDYLFFEGPPPPVLEAANVDGEGGVNVADLTYLVEYLFFGGPEPICRPIE